jgi:hypothetical protein
VHVIYVETIDDIREKLNLILFNPKIKNELEKNARIYFDAYLTPKVVIENLINRR